jgi:D-inositol-3-phosphate glycosyltransferase
MEKTKILFIGDQVTPTGFSRVLHNIINELPDEEYTKLALGVNYRGDPHTYSYPIFPATLYDHGDPYGFSRIRELCSQERPDIIFILNDMWIVDNYLGVIKDVYKGAEKYIPKIVIYTPVDAKDHDSDWYNKIDIVSELVTYTEFGKKVIEDALSKLQNTVHRPVSIIGHGVDTSIFHKLNTPKSELRLQLFPGRKDIATSKFVVLNANRNQPRKHLDITMEGFKLFLEKRPGNNYIYMHCGITDEHIHVVKLAVRFGIAHNLLLTNSTNDVQRIPEARLNNIYNMTDVGINTSAGEGWSLCQMEHAVTGAPQVVADHSALHELYQDCGQLVPATINTLLGTVMTTGKLCLPEDVATALIELYDSKELYDSLSHKAMMKFSNPEYSWKEIGKQWDQIFKKVANG